MCFFLTNRPKVGAIIFIIILLFHGDMKMPLSLHPNRSSFRPSLIQLCRSFVTLLPNIDVFFSWWKRHLRLYHLISRNRHSLMIQILAGLIYTREQVREEYRIERL